MQIMLKVNECDRCGDCWPVTPTKQPLEAAYQDSYTVIETKHIPQFIFSFDTVSVEIEGEVYTRKKVDKSPNPELEEWKKEGANHRYAEAQEQAYPSGQFTISCTREVEKTGWFVDIGSPEELADFIRIYTNEEIYFGTHFDLKNENMLVLVVYK